MPSCPNCNGPIDFDDDLCFSCGAVLSPMYASSAPPPPRNPGYPRGRRSGPPHRSRRDYDYPAGSGWEDDYPPRGYDDDYYDDYGDYDYDRPRRSPAAYPPPYPGEPYPGRRSGRRPPSGRNRQYNRPPPKRNQEDEGLSGKTIVASVVAIMLILLLLAIAFLPSFAGFRDQLRDLRNENPLNPFVREYPEGAEYQFDRTVVVSASGNFEYTIKISQPKDIIDGTEQLQDKLDIQQSKPPSSLVDIPFVSYNAQNDSNTMVIWEDQIGGGSDSLRVSYHIRTKTKVWDQEKLSTESGNLNDIPSVWNDRYLKDDWPIDINEDGIVDSDDLRNDGDYDYRIEPSNPTISSLSDQLTSDKQSVFDKVLAIYEYLISDEALEYETVRGSGLPKACTTTLADGKGDCDDYSILFVSLCRASNIPARLQLGMLFDERSNDWIGHGWAEVYIPLRSGGEVLGPVDIVNKQFLFRDPFHITDWVETGTDVRDGATYVSNFDYYYYSFNYRGVGSKDSETFNTITYDPYGSIKVKMSQAEITGMPSDEEDSGPGFGSVPGFEGYGTLAAITITVTILTILRRNKI